MAQLDHFAWQACLFLRFFCVLPAVWSLKLSTEKLEAETEQRKKADLLGFGRLNRAFPLHISAVHSLVVVLPLRFIAKCCWQQNISK